MKILIILIALVITPIYAGDYEYRDKFGGLQGTIEKDDDREGYVVKDNYGFRHDTIDEDGTVRDRFGFIKGSINVKED